MTEILPTLHLIPYSPWSENACWALDARRVRYRERVFYPVVDELPMRARLGRWSGRISMPVLQTGDTVLTDSWDIARWAAEHGEGPELFPDVAAIEGWNARVQEALAAGRELSLRRMVSHPAALMDAVPGALRFLGPLARLSARSGAVRTSRKYRRHRESDAALRATLDEVCRDAWSVLAKSPSATMLGRFSYADVLVAGLVTFLRPIEGARFRGGEGTRAVFGDAEVASRHPELLAWRDAIYAKVR